MKNSFYLHLFIFFLPFICFSQNIKNIDFIAPYNDSLAAVKQDNKWGFIDAQGNLVINFRDDLVVSNYKEGSYPVFSNNRSVFTIGFNNILKKPVVKYKYFEVLIDANGNILAYLTQTPKGIVLSADFVKEPPKITSKLINSNLVAVRNENKTWDINKIVYIE